MLVSDVILTVDRTIRDILEALSNRLSFADNFAAVTRDVVDTGLADMDFVVDHFLGRIPVGYIANPSAGYIYGDSTLWTNTQITLRCSASNVSVRLVIY